MNKRDKLVFAGLGSLVLCLALAPFLKRYFTDKPAQAAIRPQQVERRQSQRDTIRDLQELEAPAEIETTKKYLEERFAGLDEPGEAARGVDPDGQEYYLERVRVAKSPSGKTYYLKTWTMPMRLEAPVLHMKDRGKLFGSSVSTTGSTPLDDGFAKKFQNQMKPLPIDQAPEGLFQGGPKGSEPPAAPK